MKYDLCVVNVRVDDTDQEIAQFIREMRRNRADGTKEILCTIDGYSEDDRELWEIPEVRTLCKRLLTSGFASNLDAGNVPGKKFARAWGAAEVYLCSEGKLKKVTEWTLELFDEFINAWARYNGVSDAVPNNPVLN